MSASREKRQQLIKALVRDNEVRTQNELADMLREHGHNVTQATISRDIADLRLQKSRLGVYVLAEELRLHSLAAAAIIETRRADNQVVVLTEPGSASSVAAAIDAAGMDGVLGSIAGDDTILIIAQDAEAGRRFQQMLDALIA